MRILTCFVLAACLGSSPAHAQGDETGREEARLHYGRGLDLASRGNYRQALEQFLAAYRTSPHFAVLYNIGQAHIALGQPGDAVAALEQYLRDGKDQIPADRFEQTTLQIAAQKAQLAEITIAVNAPGARIAVDDREIGVAPLAEPVRVAPGSHAISVTAAGRPEVTRSVTLLAGQRLELQLDVPPAAATPPKPTGALAVVCQEPVQLWVDGTRIIGGAKNPRISLEAGPHRVALAAREHRSAEQTVNIPLGSTVTVACGDLLPQLDRARSSVSRARARGTGSTIGYVLGGVGVGVGVAALGHYVWNRGRYEDWKATHSDLKDPAVANRRERQIENNELADSIERASRVTVSLALGSGALLGTGVTLVVTDTPPGSQHNGVAASVRGVW